MQFLNNKYDISSVRELVLNIIYYADITSFRNIRKNLSRENLNFEQQIKLSILWYKVNHSWIIKK